MADFYGHRTETTQGKITWNEIKYFLNQNIDEFNLNIKIVSNIEHVPIISKIFEYFNTFSK